MLGVDEGDLLSGFLDGVMGTLSPDDAGSRAYRQGWRNGAIEAGWIAPDLDMAAVHRLMDRLRAETLAGRPGGAVQVLPPPWPVRVAPHRPGDV